jgi:sugar phosphate isomerase/epimerase
MRRRTFLKNAALFCCALNGWAATTEQALSRFKLGAISDGFSQDFEEALKIMRGYGLHWVEIRQVFGVYNTEASPQQIQQIKQLLDKYEFRVSVIDSALYKCLLPGTKPANAAVKDLYPYGQQMDLLKRACDRAQALGAGKIRGFAFWRVAQPESTSERIAEELAKAADVARGAGMRLVIENEESCNAATGHELAAILSKAASEPNLGANWDVGNGYTRGEVSFPDGYRALDKKRILHMHLKGMSCDDHLMHCKESFTDKGQIDLAGQFRALLRDGYQETMSLECEFKAPGLSHQETAKRSMEGLLKVLAAAVSGTE